MQIAEAVRAQLDATGDFALESRRAGIGRRQALDNYHLIRLGILESIFMQLSLATIIDFILSMRGVHRACPTINLVA